MLKDEMIRCKLLERDGSVLETVINKYSRLLWSISSAVLKNAGSEQDVEECVADTFIYLWEHPERFEPERGSLQSLLCILTRSRSIDRYRAITRKETVPLEEAMISEGLGLQERILEEETRRELLAAVKALEEPGREILVRRYYYGQKPREIALALGMTAKQVDNSLYRSKKALRNALQEVGE